MKLHYKINLTSLGILLLVSLAIVIAAGTVITRISYDLNRKLMFKEISILQADIQAAINVLNQSGVAGVEEYRIAAQNDLLDELKEKYRGEGDETRLVVVERSTGLPLMNGPRDAADLQFLKTLAEQESGTLHAVYEGQSRYFCFDNFEEWSWLIVLYESDAKLLETRRTFFSIVLVIMVISIVAGAAYLIWSTNRIVEPIRQLAGAADELSHGNWDTPLPKVRTSDEIALLTESFRQMSVNLLSTYKDLNNHIELIKSSQNELATEKERLAITLRSIGDGVICTDTDGRITLINNIAEEVTGWSQEHALGEHFSTVFSLVGESTQQQGADYHNILAQFRKGAHGELPDQLHLVARNKVERTISASGAPIFDTNGSALGAIIVFRDISESIKMQEELIKAYKLESVGILAGGIAHDFNNLLTGILGNISLAKLSAEDNDGLAKKLDAAEKASLRAKDLTKQLLTFSRGGEPVKKLISLVKLVEEATMLSLAGSNCRCEYRIAENLWSVEADEGQISQVIHNLVINAGQAMPEGGTIQITAENIDINQENSLLLQPGPYLLLSIHDSGIGIEKNALTKIFDPYFTTKSGGSGLGLASAYSIIKKHNGHIEVESEQGKGTTFRIYLPASEQNVEAEAHQTEHLKHGVGSVLILDDEEIVREVGGSMLTSLGYNVEFASDGETAIAMYKGRFDQGSRFDLVIMDLTIPGGMGGKEAIEHLRAIDPSVQAIVSSGYANDPIMANYSKYGFSAILSKPFSIEELSRTLGELQEKVG